MSNAVAAPPRPHGVTAAVPAEFRWTPAAYEQASEFGLFQDRRVELIRGRILEMPAMQPDEVVARRKTIYRLRDYFKERDRYIIDGRVPLRLEDSEPEPDLFVFRGTLDEETSDPDRVVLVVEVAHSTLAFDRGQKLSLYAETGYRDYWILNVADRVLEVYRTPARSADGTWTYADRTTIGPGGTVSPLVRPQATLHLDALLPPRP